MVMHQGDFAYSSNVDGWTDLISNALGSPFPYLGSVGNHDATAWNMNNENNSCPGDNGCYSKYFKDVMQDHGITPDHPDLNDQKYAFAFNGIKFVLVGENGNNVEFAEFIDDQLTGTDHIWNICSWHRNQREMQIGGKTSEMGWDVYENCREHGAIVATAHEHSYERTRSLVQMQNQTVDSTCSDPADLCVGVGTTFAFVSGLGGHSIRDQERCLPLTFPYGCNGEWAKIYTTDQDAQYGALFIEFHIDNDPRKAHSYFKNINGQIIDSFDITSSTN